MLRLKVVVAVAVALLFISPAHSSDKTPVATVRANSRLIVLDVVATDKNEQPLTKLRAEDFTVFEDGKPQQLNGFELHVSKPGARLEAPSLRAGQFTNPNEVPDGPINILLIDAMNSSFLNQAETRKAVVHFLTTLPERQPLAIFVLGERLRMLQGFTTDSTLWRKAALEYAPETTTVQRRETMNTSSMELAKRIAKQGAMVGGLLKAIEYDKVSNTEYRVTETMNAFKQLARAVSGYTQRKNLIWLSGSFPLNLQLKYLPWASEEYERNVREITNLLATTKISVYPVDIRGMSSGVSLVSDPVDIRDLSAGTSLLSNELMTFRVFADDTGGRAFYNSNDIEIAMSRSVELGSAYYTLSYAPQNRKWNGNFRSIKVEVKRGDTKLFYRRGYYAVDESATPATKKLERDFQLTMIPESPLATGILVSARVVERKSDGITVVEFGIPGSQLRLRDGEGRPFAAKYGFGLMGWDKDGKLAGMGSEVWNLPGDPNIVSKIEREGWAHRVSAKISPRATWLRVAVQDQTTGNIGAVDIPLSLTP